MDNNKSLDEVTLIATLLHDISLMHGSVFDTRAVTLTVKKLRQRCSKEGMSFLTKTLPALGKALDRALSQNTPLNVTDLGWETLEGTSLPKFLGELFSQVFDGAGNILPNPCVSSVKWLRQVLYMYYKYELPYSPEQEQSVLDLFKRTEQEQVDKAPLFRLIESMVLSQAHKRLRYGFLSHDAVDIARKARILLHQLFADFDPSDITPRHGPGAVATKQQLWEKYQWKNVSDRITAVYPLDAYFFASLSHFCDDLRKAQAMGGVDYPARVILVPKDSRGPRLISAEPVDFQWIQQGLRDAIYRLVESHPLTRDNVHFTDQGPNQRGAYVGSLLGKYATLDLAEASDRVNLDLVRLLFPAHIVKAMEACRTQATKLPNGEVVKLQKFAPMGSALCFPVLALTIWSILAAGLSDDIRKLRKESLPMLVYGDDVVVPTAQAERAIELLEVFGLKVNRDKSCFKGLFRESCGVDAFKGENVTPVKIRTVWTSSPSASVYTSWIAYANRFYDMHCFLVYQYLVEILTHSYGPIPDQAEIPNGSCPVLRERLINRPALKRRTNPNLQKVEYYVWVVKAVKVRKQMSGWSMLLRYFTEAARPVLAPDIGFDDPEGVEPFSVRSYTRRRASMLVRRWR